MSSEDVAIFWDYENCAAATQYTGYEIVKKIRHVAHHFGTIKFFKAYLELSDPAAFSRSLVIRSELQSSGVSLTDCPHNGRKDVADKMMLVDMLAYAIDNPPPSTIILISGDRDFAYAVSVLRLRRYRVVIISLPGIHTSLKIQASIFLDWNTDVLGADVVDDCWSPRDGPVTLQREYWSSSASHHHRENSNRDFPSSLRRPGRSSGEGFDVDIMDHLRYKGNDHNGGHPDARVNGETFKEPSSYPRPATPTSSEVEGSSSTTRSPPQMETPPAAVLTDETSSTPTVVSKPSATEDRVESTTAVSGTSLSTNETQSSLEQASVAENIAPLPVSPISSQGMIAVQNQDSLSTLGSTPNTVLTSLPSKQTPVPPSTQLPSVDATPKENAVSAQQSTPKVVPPKFNLLVQRLEFHRLKGFPRPFRSGIAVELASTDNTVYRKAGTERFGQYVALAEKAGIIELGGKEGGAWIGLRPEWYDAKIG